MAQRAPEALAAATAEFTQAVEIDPDYALAHASLAIALGLSAGPGRLTEAEARGQGRPHAERALELDPGLAEAHAALGWVNWDPATLDEAESHFRRATELNPGYADAHIWLGHFVRNRNDYVESFALYQKAAQLDPLSIPAKNNVILALIWRGRLAEAGQLVEKVATLAPGNPLAWDVRLREFGGNWAEGALGTLDAIRSGDWSLYGDLQARLALMGMEREALLDPAGRVPNGKDLTQAYAMSVDTLFLLGRPAEALAAWERLPGGIPQELGPDYLWSGVLVAAAGDFARAGTILERVWPEFHRRAGINLPSRDANFILALRLVRQERGDLSGMAELEVALRDAVRRYAEAGLVLCDVLSGGCVHFDAGISAYLDGNREQGLALIAQSVETGYYVPPNHAFLQFLYDDPGFGAILERQAAHQTRQREKFLAVVCNDNPYADVWQPEAETCGKAQPPDLAVGGTP
jgi:tetratricopeptide (TPR) repeat protein